MAEPERGEDARRVQSMAESTHVPNSQHTMEIELNGGGARPGQLQTRPGQGIGLPTAILHRCRSGSGAG